MLNRVDILCISQACWYLNFHTECFPRTDEKTHAHTLISEGGGPAANASYCIASWGGKAAFVGSFGKDHFGQKHLYDLKSAGVNVSRTLNSNTDTSVSSIWVNGEGSRSIINYRDGKETNDLDVSGFEPTCLLVDGHEHSASLKALQEYPNVPSILDAGSWREETKNLSEKVTYLIASNAFAKDASGSENPEDWIKCLSPNAPYMAITNGPTGVYWKDPKCLEGHIEAAQAFAIDTTGAGDIFHAAFALEIASNHSFYGCLCWANAVAGLSVSQYGGRTSCPKPFDLPSLGLLESVPE